MFITNCGVNKQSNSSRSHNAEARSINTINWQYGTKLLRLMTLCRVSRAMSSTPKRQLPEE